MVAVFTKQIRACFCQVYFNFFLDLYKESLCFILLEKFKVHENVPCAGKLPGTRKRNYDLIFINREISDFFNLSGFFFMFPRSVRYHFY